MQGSNASWPVGGATRQSGGNWVGRFEKPEDWSIWASMYSSNLELGQLITVGDSILKWTAAGVKFVDAAFATQADLDSFCSKIGTPIAAGSTAMVAGVQYTYGAAGWVHASDIGPGSLSAPFATEAERTAWATANLSTLRSGVSTVWGPGDSTEWEFVGPEADKWRGIRGPYLGSAENPYPASTTIAELVALAATGPEEIWVVNPGVPRGKSRLVVNAARTKYIPPPHELIFRLRTGDTPISLTPGVAAIVPVFESSEIIPTYMFSDIFRVSANMYIKNAAGAATCMVMVAVSGVDPTSVEASEYPLFMRNFTPTASGCGIRPEQVGYGEISGDNILKGAWGIGDPNTVATANSRGRTVPFGNNAGRFVAGSMKVYAKAVTKHANDNVVLHWIDVWSD